MTLKEALKEGQVAVIHTDTIYGIVGSALLPDTVERIYKLRKRDLNKPFIILISSVDDLRRFDISVDKKTKEILHELWPGPVSVVLNIPPPRWDYLHRGTKSLAFRVPKDKKLLTLLKQTGPLVAPSANPEGEKPAQSISEAKKYFGNQVDHYVDGGKINGKPSTLVKIENNHLVILRP